jgi:hypothetical protein
MWPQWHEELAAQGYSSCQVCVDACRVQYDTCRAGVVSQFQCTVANFPDPADRLACTQRWLTGMIGCFREFQVCIGECPGINERCLQQELERGYRSTQQSALKMNRTLHECIRGIDLRRKDLIDPEKLIDCVGTALTVFTEDSALDLLNVAIREQLRCCRDEK